MSKVPPTKKRAPTVTVPRDLVERTVNIVLKMSAHQVYPLIREWEIAVPDLFIVTRNGEVVEET